MNMHVGLLDQKGAQAFRASPHPPLLCFTPYYDDNRHIIRHLHSLSQGVQRRLEKAMIEQGLPPRLFPHHYHGLLVIADDHALQAHQPLYREPGAGNLIAGIATVPHNSHHAVLALYTCGTLFKQIGQRVRNHNGSRYDVLKVTMA